MRQTLIRALITAVCTVAVSMACTPGSPPGPISAQGPAITPSVPAGVSGRLLMTRDLGLWTLNLATARTEQVAKPPEMGQVLSARWSPDGSRVAYALFEVKDRRTPASSIVVANADGSTPRTVLSTEGSGRFFQTPVWDPDGQHLYVLHLAQTSDERIRRIARVNLESGELTTVTEEIGQFDVSPDGRRLAIVRSAAGASSVVVLDLASGEQRVLVPDRQYETITSVRFDPTGGMLVFAAAPPTTAVRDALGLAGLARQLVGIGAIAQAHGPPQDLFTVPIGGGQATRLIELQADEPVAAYSPDGANLAILAIDSLSVLQISTGARTRILSPGGAGSIDWAP